MICRALQAAAAVALICAWPCASGATPQVWLPPVLDEVSASPDSELTRALREAAALVAPRGWPWRDGHPAPDGCAEGCRVILIQGRRADTARYALSRMDLPTGPGAAVSLALPAGAGVEQIARALLVKCSFLLQEVAPPSSPAPAPSAERAPPAPAATARARPDEAPPPEYKASTFTVGPSLTVGLDNTSYFTLGFEMGGIFNLYGPLAVRAAIGFQSLGEGEIPGGALEFNAMPINLQAGGWWRRSWWRGGVFGGLSMTALWINFENDMLPRSNAVSVGLGLEGRAAMQLHRFVELGLAVRFAYMPDPAEVEVNEETLYEAPSFLLGVTAELGLAM